MARPHTPSSASLDDIALQCGVSVATVSAVLRGKTQGLRRDARERAERIHAVANRLGYRPSAAARNLRHQRSGLIGLLTVNNRGVDALSHPNLYASLLGATATLTASAQGSLLIPMDDLASDPQHQAFHQRMLDGLIVFGAVPERIAIAIRALAVPTIWADGPHREPRGCIWRDEVAAGQLAGAAVRAAGYRHCQLLRTSAEPELWRVERLTGLRAGLGADIALTTHEIAHDQPGAWAQVDAIRIPGAVMVTETAYGANWLVCQSAVAGLQLGRDLPCVSLDDSPLLARACPQLARVSFDRFRLGAEAVQMLSECSESGEPSPSRMLTDTFRTGASLPTL